MQTGLSPVCYVLSEKWYNKNSNEIIISQKKMAKANMYSGKSLA